MLFPHLHKQGVHLGPLGILVADVGVLGANVDAVLVTAGPGVLSAAPVSRAHLSVAVISDLGGGLGSRLFPHLHQQGVHLGPLGILVAAISIRGADPGAVLLAAGPGVLIAAKVSRAHLGAVISDLCNLCGGLGPHLHQQGVHLGAAIVSPLGILVADVRVLGADVGAVLVTADEVINWTAPVPVTHLPGALIADIWVLGADIGALLLAAGEVGISAAPVTWTHHTGAVISHLGLGGNSLLHLLDQGQHLGIALPCMASLCCDSRHSHKAESKS